MHVELYKKMAMQSLVEFAPECVSVEGKHVYDGDVCMKLLKVGSVGGEF